jgi:hypothetical protein
MLLPASLFYEASSVHHIPDFEQPDIDWVYHHGPDELVYNSVLHSLKVMALINT